MSANHVGGCSCWVCIENIEARLKELEQAAWKKDQELPRPNDEDGAIKDKTCDVASCDGHAALSNDFIAVCEKHHWLLIIKRTCQL